MTLLAHSDRTEDALRHRAPDVVRSQVAGRGAFDVVAPIPTDFRLASGQRLGQRSITGRIQGPANAPVVVVAGGISADRFVHRTATGGRGWCPAAG